MTTEQFKNVVCTVRGEANAQAIFDTLAQSRLTGHTHTGVQWAAPSDKRKSHVLRFQYFSHDKAKTMLLALYPRMRKNIKCVEVPA